MYALIGLFVIDRIDLARNWPDSDGHRNAHTRRELNADADDIIVVGTPERSGRLACGIPIGEYRDRDTDAPRSTGPVRRISANNGYLQRSAVFPSLVRPKQFLKWLEGQVLQAARVKVCWLNRLSKRNDLSETREARPRFEPTAPWRLTSDRAHLVSIAALCAAASFWSVVAAYLP